MTQNQTLTSIDNILLQKIIEHESIIPFAYQDSKGYWTIGCGRLIDKRLNGRLTDDECRYLLNNDILQTQKELNVFSWYTMQDEVRRGVLIEMAFNMGVPRLLTFKNMISALEQCNYKKAVDAMLSSKWAAQDVGKERSSDMASRMLTGAYA